MPRGNDGGHAKTNPYNWVGGTDIEGLYGAAHKSWFMFDDEIVCLGSGINSSDNRIIETIIETVKSGTMGKMF